MKMKKRLPHFALALIAALLLSINLYAQQTTSGTLRSPSGEVLVGATVTVKGTNRSVTTDANGRFTIEAPAGSTLVVSSVGFQNREITVTGSELNETLQITDATLSEVVVIGYQTVRRRDLTGAVGVINPAAANRNISNTVAESIQGLTPGVTVRNTGAPGGGAKIDIRGAGTFAGNNPLYIIDGMYSDATPDFNPQDVESIQILKDASAAAIYGSRAANGVIIITTKRGRTGPPKFNGSVKAGIQNVHNRYDMMNAAEYRNLATKLYQAGNSQVPTSLTTDFDLNIDTDWQEEFLRQGAIAEYNLGVSGSLLKRVNFYVSGNHFQNKGPVIDNSFSRSAFRINTDTRFGRFTIGQNLSLSWTKEDPIAAGGVGVNPFVDMITMPPVVPLRGSRFVSAENPEGYGIGLGTGNSYLSTLTANVPALQYLDQFEQNNFKLRGNAYVDVRLIEGLTYRFNFGLEKTVDRGDGTRFPGTVRQGTPSPNNNRVAFFRSKGEFESQLFEHTLNYEKAFGVHRLSAVLGSSNQTFDHPINRFTTITETVEDPYTNRWNNIGLLGRVNYNFQDKYLTSITFRRDGSSLFSEGNRWGNFPSASVAWRISKESFWNVKAINDLKLRASYGSLGNSEFLQPWLYYAQINPFPRAVFGADSAFVGGIVTRLANNDLRWERKKTTNFGLDAAFLDNRFTVSADYFIAESKDVLVDLPISATTGNAGGNPAVNAATLQNKGFEFALTYRPKPMGDFNWDATLNFTAIRNKVIAFGNQTTKYTQLGDARTELGRSIGEWYVLKTEGIFQSQAEIDAHKGKTGSVLQPWSKPGDIRYADVDGDGTLDLDKDRYYAGSPWAKWESGLQLNASYKKFSVNMQWYAVVGNELYNRPRYNVDRMDQNTNFRQGATFWTPQTPSSEWPRAAITSTSDKGLEYNVLPQSDRWLEDGSYLRLRNLEIAYNFDKSFLSRVGFNNSRVFLNGQNLITFTKYTGLDPDITGVNIFERGLDNGQYPALRIISAGISFGF